MGLVVLLLTALVVLIVLGTAALAYILTHPPRRTAGSMLAQGLPMDPGEAGAEFETVLIDGAEDLGDGWLVRGETVQGPVIVMLHGWGDSKFGELLWLDVLRPAASSLVLFDLPGHGESPVRTCGWGRREVADGIKVVDWARDRLGGRPIVLMGYSMGAALAMSTARRMSGKIAGVIADSPYARPVEAIAGMMRLNRAPSWPMTPLASALLRSCRLGEQTRHSAEHIGCPLLVLHGDADRVVCLKSAADIAGAAPHGTLVTFAGCDHLEAASAKPAEYAAAVAQFLSSI